MSRGLTWNPSGNMLSVPVFPDVRAETDGGFPAVSYDGRFNERGVLQKLFLNVLVISQIFDKLIAPGFFVNHGLKPHGAFDAVKLAAAHTVADKVDALEFYTALLEIALGLFGVKAF